MRAISLLILMSVGMAGQLGRVDIFKGKVVTKGGPPPGPVTIERVCPGAAPSKVATTDQNGEYSWAATWRSMKPWLQRGCKWRAVLDGYVSTAIGPDRSWQQQRESGGSPEFRALPDLVLIRANESPVEYVPRAEAQRWAKALKASGEKRWTEAEATLRDILASYPTSAPVWTALGTVLKNQGKVADARGAYQSALGNNSRFVQAYLELTGLEIAAGDWEAAARSATAGIKADTEGVVLGLYVLDAIIRHQRNDLDGASTSARRAIEFDPEHRQPRAEYVLGMVLEARRDYLAAATHFRAYLDMTPEARDTEAVRTRIKRLESPGLHLEDATIRLRAKDIAGAEASAQRALALDPERKQPQAEYILGGILEARREHVLAAAHLCRYLNLAPNAPEADAVRRRIVNLAGNARCGIPAAEPPVSSQSVPGVSDIVIAGGLKALATMAHLDRTPSPQDFFREYCREVVLNSRPGFWNLPAYLQAVEQLSALGTPAGDLSLVTLSLETPLQCEKTRRALGLMGWRIKQGTDVAGEAELGDEPANALRQEIPAALGIDELAMAQSLAAGKTFEFVISSGKAGFFRVDLWDSVAGNPRASASSFLEAFARNPRYAMVYAGLAAMSHQTAAVITSGIGLPALVNKYAGVFYRRAGSFTVADGHVAVPGGAQGEPSWEKLAGASPRDPKAFFRALLETDGGMLAAFYSAVWRGDDAHQRFFTQGYARAERFYRWYRDSERLPRVLPLNPWIEEFFQQLPLDPAGGVRFPGGRAAWSSVSGPDEEVLLGLPSLEALVAIAKLEEGRKTPLDAISVKLLAEHHDMWRALFPYFEKLPGLGRGEFEALAAFEEAVSGQPRDRQNIVLGEWHSLVKLIELGARAGSLDAEAAARAFRRACEALSSPDYSQQALAALRTLAGGISDLEEAVPSRLLRLDAGRRTSFDEVKRLQRAPRLATAAGSDQQTLAALSGQVYAALLDPDSLLVVEDPLLLGRHQFVYGANRATVFFLSEAVPAKSTGETLFTGGFEGFEHSAQILTRERTPAGGKQAPQADFQTSSRLVEVYATVTDGHGGYVDALDRGEFTVLDNGKPVRIQTFRDMSGVSVALLLDASASMTVTLPALREAALDLIGVLRPIDWVSVYSFTQGVAELQSLTTNKDAAKRAVQDMRVLDRGGTAFYDALARVSRDLRGRSGRKLLVAFTDGADNASTLGPEAAIRQVRAAGVPVCTIAYGEALADPQLPGNLEVIAKDTGGVFFSARESADIGASFERISRDYLSQSELSGLALALVLDSSDSMMGSLPALKKGALALIDTLRPIDSAAVYSFNQTISEPQLLTTNKDAVKRAVLRARAWGTTALNDALVRVNRDLTGRGGKRRIVLFSDGADTASVLSSEAAIRRAKATGIPVYTVAYGEALQQQRLQEYLGSIAKATGGLAFAIRTPAEIGAVFERVALDLMHGYVLAFRPAVDQTGDLHSIQVVLRNGKGRHVRAREAYYPE